VLSKNKGFHNEQRKKKRLILGLFFEPIAYMPNPTKSASLFFLFLFFFFLAGCAKPQVAFKPRPSPILQDPQGPEFPLMRIEVNGQKISPLVPTLFMLPEDPIVIRIQAENPQTAGNQIRSRQETESWSVVFNGRSMPVEGNNLFSGTVPKDPGFYPLEIKNRQKSNQVTVYPNLGNGQRREKTEPILMVIVLHPFSKMKDGFIDQYPMGFYPNQEEAPANIIPIAARSHYLPPKGFIEVTASNQGAFVSQHYRLEDFTTRLNGPFPQFIALFPALLLKLEWLTLSLIQYSQSPEARLNILSGFRTPRYNQSVSGALWSRHIYGDAADIIVDMSPKDGQMDDLNRDGRVDREDVMILAKFIEEIEIKTGLWGGLGIFDRGINGPSIHIDTRGFKARW
jgi:hypothetical protein